MAKNRSVQEIDFGYTKAEEYWFEMVLPSYKIFLEKQDRQTAIAASWPAWHVHEWLWYEKNPGINIQHNEDYYKFRGKFLDECEELGWVSDIADAGKHRYLGRAAEVQRVQPSTPSRLVTSDGEFIMVNNNGQSAFLVVNPGGLQIELTDGSKHFVSTVFETVIEFWRDYFEKEKPLP